MEMEGPPGINRGPEVRILNEPLSSISPTGSTPQQPPESEQVATNAGRNLPSRNYWCHLCRTHTTEAVAINDDIACPLCSQSFIEELPSESAAVGFLDQQPSTSQTLPLTYEQSIQPHQETELGVIELVENLPEAEPEFVNVLESPTPMSQEDMTKLPRLQITQREVEAKVGCSVCQDNFKLGEKVCKLQCEHIFHEICILPWLRRRASCPNCRKCFSQHSGVDLARRYIY